MLITIDRGGEEPNEIIGTLTPHVAARDDASSHEAWQDVIGARERLDAVFVGGGGDQSLFDALWATIPKGSRLVVNAVTLETEALLMLEQRRRGGDLMRVELSQATPLGKMRSWVSSRPVVQWSVVR